MQLNYLLFENLPHELFTGQFGGTWVVNVWMCCYEPRTLQMFCHWLCLNIGPLTFTFTFERHFAFHKLARRASQPAFTATPLDVLSLTHAYVGP